MTAKFRYDWNKYGRPRVALFNRIMTRALPCLTAAVWVLCIRVAVHDWTILLAPLPLTAGSALLPPMLRRVYGVSVPECDCHRHQVPVRGLLGEHVAQLCTECGRQVYMAAWVFRGQG